MSPEQIEKLLNLTYRQARALEQIAFLLGQSIAKPKPPNYKDLLENFQDFDWPSINAKVETSDDYGPATIIWNGDRYKRRSPSNKFGPVVFFSRCVGTGQTGQQYERLITFEPASSLKVEPLSRQAETYLMDQVG